MRKILFGTLFVAMLLAGNNSIAQNPVYDVGPVWRMIYYRFNPGQGGVFWSDLYPELKATTAEAMRQGEIIDYKFFANPLKNHPGDWEILLMLKYPNYAALDGLGPKSDAVYKKQYPNAEKAEKIVKERNEVLEVISSSLLREVPLK